LAAAPIGYEGALALGLLNPVKTTLGINHQVAIRDVLSALRVDAETIAGRLTREQQRELGVGPPPTPEDQAMWDSDDDYQWWAKEQRRKLNEMAAWALPDQRRQMSREMRDE